MHKVPGRVLVIAGSDSGGGAGIQADIKTITLLGGYAATAITAVTVQNTLGVRDVHPVPADTVAAQIAAVLDDIGADAIKTGMLFSAEIIHAVADELDRSNYTGKLVVDPVMVATSGDRLLQAEAVEALTTRLLPRATIVTPNLPEAEILINRKLSNYDDYCTAGEEIVAMGAEAALIKGGHASGDYLTDVLISHDHRMRLKNRRINSRHTHGTGCTLASAIAAGLASGMNLETAVRQARSFVRHAIENAPGFGKGHGPMGFVPDR